MEKEEPGPSRNPFSDSANISIRTNSDIPQAPDLGSRLRTRKFESYRLTGEYETPWTSDKRLKRTRVGNYIIWTCIVVGLGISAYLNYAASQRVPQHPVSIPAVVRLMEFTKIFSTVSFSTSLSHPSTKHGTRKFRFAAYVMLSICQLISPGRWFRHRGF